MSHLLRKLGLTRDDVRRGLHIPTPASNYLTGRRQSFIRDRMQLYGSWVVTQFLAGESPIYIAACLGVCEESVRKRLRADDLFDTGGRKGRPAR